MTQIYKTGIDVGSTTVKLVVFDENFKLIFSRYERHFSDVKAATIKVFKDFIEEYGDLNLELAITGSGGMGLAEVIDVPFERPRTVRIKENPEFQKVRRRTVELLKKYENEEG